VSKVSRKNFELLYAYNSSKFSVSLLTFAPWYFFKFPDFPWSSDFSMTFPDRRNHGYRKIYPNCREWLWLSKYNWQCIVRSKTLVRLKCFFTIWLELLFVSFNTRKSTILRNFCYSEITGFGRHQCWDSGLAEMAGIPLFGIAITRIHWRFAALLATCALPMSYVWIDCSAHEITHNC